MKTVRDLAARGKKVLVRVDYNVPLSNAGEVLDKQRFEETLPTLNHLLEQGAALILMSHLGRPKGKPDPAYSLRGVAGKLGALLQRNVEFAKDCIGQEAEKEAVALQAGRVLMLENLRFHPEEEKNDESFARSLASLGDVYVNDAFGACHRAHASIVGIPKFKPAFAGLLLEKELQMLSPLLEGPARPYFAILGGAKLSDKLAVVGSLLPRVDALLIGGAMAFTFLKAQGYGIGTSLVEDKFLEEAGEVLKQYSAKVKLPLDCLAASSNEHPEQARPVVFSKKGREMENLQGLDLGPRSIEAYLRFIKAAKPRTIFWNGPMGVFEVPAFAVGTRELAKALGNCAGAGVEVIVGGGDSIAALNQLGLSKRMTHLSTGGGASLEFLEGKTLPGIAALQAASPARRA